MKTLSLTSGRMIHLKLMNQSAQIRSPRLLHGNVPAELCDGPIMLL